MSGWLAVLPQWRSVFGIFGALKRARRKRKTRKEALEWHMRTHGGMQEHERLGRGDFRYWRRALGEETMAQIEADYHRHKLGETMR